jgi:hypothetical protein
VSQLDGLVLSFEQQDFCEVQTVYETVTILLSKHASAFQFFSVKVCLSIK